MDYKIVLDVDGIDLRDEHTLELLADAQYEIGWGSVDGRPTATIFARGSDPASHAVEVAHWVQNSIAGTRVARVNEELVSIAEIAAELSVSRETVRSWVVGKRGPGGFPRSRATVGGGSKNPVRIWAWSDVSDWLTKKMCIEIDYLPLSPEQVADINAHLRQVPPRDGDGGPDAAWRHLGPMSDSQAATLRHGEGWDANRRVPLAVGNTKPLNSGQQFPVPTRSSGRRR